MQNSIKFADLPLVSLDILKQRIVDHFQEQASIVTVKKMKLFRENTLLSKENQRSIYFTWI